MGLLDRDCRCEPCCPTWHEHLARTGKPVPEDDFDDPICDGCRRIAWACACSLYADEEEASS